MKGLAPAECKWRRALPEAEAQLEEFGQKHGEKEESGQGTADEGPEGQKSTEKAKPGHPAADGGPPLPEPLPEPEKIAPLEEPEVVPEEGLPAAVAVAPRSGVNGASTTTQTICFETQEPEEPQQQHPQQQGAPTTPKKAQTHPKPTRPSPTFCSPSTIDFLAGMLLPAIEEARERYGMNALFRPGPGAATPLIKNALVASDWGKGRFADASQVQDKLARKLWEAIKEMKPDFRRSVGASCSVSGSTSSASGPQASDEAPVASGKLKRKNANTDPTAKKGSAGRTEESGAGQRVWPRKAALQRTGWRGENSWAPQDDDVGMRRFLR